MSFNAGNNLIGTLAIKSVALSHLDQPVNLLQNQDLAITLDNEGGQNHRQTTSMANHLSRLPAELIQDVLLFSGNLNIAFTCRQFHIMLNNETVRLQLCANVFDARHDWGSFCPPLAEAQAALLAKQWFNHSFCARVELAIMKRRISCKDYQKLRAEGKMSQEIYHASCTPGTTLPERLLSTTWPDEKLLRRLLRRWKAEAKFKGEHQTALIHAVEQGDLLTVSLLVHPGVAAKVEEEFLLHSLDIDAHEGIIHKLLSAYQAYESGFGSSDLNTTDDEDKMTRVHRRIKHTARDCPQGRNGRTRTVLTRGIMVDGEVSASPTTRTDISFKYNRLLNWIMCIRGKRKDDALLKADLSRGIGSCQE